MRIVSPTLCVAISFILSPLVSMMTLAQGPLLCARVGLRVEQTATLTRSAFRASFTMTNPTAGAVSAIGVAIDIRDRQGNPANDRFVIAPPTLVGLSGVTGSGTLAPGASGTATWTIIPTDAAALVEPTEYAFGGTLTYAAGGTGFNIPLSPDRLNVNPNPRLRVKYFWEKYVYSDDPTTSDYVEPPQPFSVGVQVSNVGAGVARNFQLTSAQPVITSNDRGLLVNFFLLRSQFQDAPHTTSLTGSLGDIAPGQTRVARFLMSSSLQGRFIDYRVRYQHLDPLGGLTPSVLELIGPNGPVPPNQQTQAFELHHVVRSRVPGADQVGDFLTNDVPAPSDPNENAADPFFSSVPDTVHFSDGNVSPASVNVRPTLTPAGALSYIIDAGGLGADAPPWRYVRADLPVVGRYRLLSVTRSDGLQIELDTNAWLTDRVFRESGFSVVYRNRIHLFDHAGSGRYTVVLEADTTNPAPAPRFEQEPESQRGCIGRPAELRARAVSVYGNMTYQWRRNGVPIDGQTGPVLTIPTLRARDAGLYDVVASDGVAFTVSRAARLEVPAVRRWVMHDGLGPTPRSDAAAALVPLAGGTTRIALFGGLEGTAAVGTPRGDTWEWDGSAWMQTGSSGPAASYGGVAAFFPAISRVVLFGGRGAGGSSADTWLYSPTGRSWARSALVGPSARFGHAGVFDSFRDRIVLFGGDTAAGLSEGSYSGETWEFLGAAWQRQTSSGPAPAPRAWHAMAFDASRRRTVMFGGVTADGLAGDTWEWDGLNWTPRSTGIEAPAPRRGARMVFDPIRGVCVLWGGQSAPGDTLDDTWEWNGTQWSRRGPFPGSAPSSRLGHAMVFDLERDETLLFGGRGASSLGDTRTLRYTGPADVNTDGATNIDDLNDFIACYFTQPPCELSDFNGDGSVNIDDLTDFITALFSGCD